MADLTAAIPGDKFRVAFFGTHPKQFNGYSKVVYELSKAMTLHHPEVELHVFGFQNFHGHPGYRLDVPKEVVVFDAHAEENPKAQGFGITVARAFVERVKPHVCVIFNDFMVLTAVMNEIHGAANRASFKILAYLDQVYLCQKREFIEHLNRTADGAIAFTPEWRDCIQWQGLTLPCHYLQHGLNTSTFFPVPRGLVRRFYGVSEGDFLVLNLNRNQPRKRWDTCLQAFAEVVARRPNAPIKIVIATELRGAWDLVELYQRELRKRGVDLALGMSRIVVPGHPQMLTDQETNILYNLADIGINTCDGEGFGLCNFEQAAIGIPQIVPRLGGFLDFFDDDTAVLVNPVTSIYVDASRDGVGGEAQLTRWSDYADAILRLYDDPSARERIGKAARERILSRYTWRSVADKFYEIVASARPPSPAPAAPLVDPLANVVGIPDSARGTSKDDSVDVELVLKALGEEEGDADVVVAEAPSEPASDSTSSTSSQSQSQAVRDEIQAIRQRLDQLMALAAGTATGV